MFIGIELDSHRFHGGDLADVTTVIRHGTSREVSVQVSIVTQIRTENGIHQTERLKVAVFEGELGDGEHHLPVAVTIPNGPFSYQGELVQVVWFVVTRVEFDGRSSRSANTAIHVNYRPSPDAVIQPYTMPKSVMKHRFTNAEQTKIVAGVGLLCMGGTIGVIVGSIVPFVPAFLASVAFGSAAAISAVDAPIGRWRAERALADIQLSVEPKKAAPGQRVEISLMFEVARDVTISSAHLRIVCVEAADAVQISAYEGKPARQRIAIKTMLDVSDAVGRWGAGERCRIDREFTIPADAPVSLRVGVAEVAWRAELALSVNGHTPQMRTQPFVVAHNPRLFGFDGGQVVAT